MTNTVLIVTGDFVETGGMDRANHALAKFLADQGYDVHLVAHHASFDLLGRANVRLHRAYKPLGSYLLGSPVLGTVGKVWAKRLAAAGARVIVNGGNCSWGDVNWVHYVHAADGGVGGTQAGAWGRIVGALKRRYFLRAERRSLQHAQLVIANSDRTRDDLIQCCGVPEERILTVYLGVDARFCPVTDVEKRRLRKELGWEFEAPNFLFVGAVGDRRKGFASLILAWRHLMQKPDWHGTLTVVGASRDAAAWRSHVADLGVGRSVRFLGKRADMDRLYQASDALVAPSSYEPYGLAVHEAICCGLPAFVPSVAGVAERYPAVLHNLLLQSPASVDDLVAKLSAWKSVSREALGRFSQQLRSRTWSDMSSEIQTLLEDRASHKGAHADRGCHSFT